MDLSLSITHDMEIIGAIIFTVLVLVVWEFLITTGALKEILWVILYLGFISLLAKIIFSLNLPGTLPTWIFIVLTFGTSLLTILNERKKTRAKFGEPK